MKALKDWIGPLALAAVLLAGAALPHAGRPFQVVVLAAMLAALWSAGSRLARWLAPDFEGESHAVAAFSLAVAIAVVPATWLGHFGALRPGPFLAWTAAALLLSRLPPVREEAATVPAPGADRRGRIYTALLLAAGLAIGCLGFHDLIRLRYAPAGAYGFDDISYHLSAVAVWLRHGDLRMIRFSMGDPSTAFYPVQGELVSWALIAPFRDSDAVARWSQLPFALFSFLAAAAIGRRLGLGRRDAAFAAIAYGGIFHVFPLLAIGAGNDHGTSFFTLAGLDAALALARRSRPARPGVAVVAGVALGQLLGTKYIGVMFAPVVLAVLVLAWLFERPRRPVRPLLALGLLALAVMAAVGGYTYLRNAVTTGNPIFPAPVRLFGVEVFPGLGGVTVLERSNSPEFRIDLWRFLTRRSRLFGSYFPFTLLPAALLAPFVAFARRRWTAGVVFLLPAAFFLQFLFLMHDHRDNRYFLPAIALAAVAFSWLLAQAGARAAFFRMALLAWITFQATNRIEWSRTAEVLTALSCLALGALLEIAFQRGWDRPLAPWRTRWAWLAAAAVLVAALPLGRMVAKFQREKLANLPSVRALEDLAGPDGARVAYAGLNQPYFFFGSRFQNDLEIVPRNRNLAARFHEWGRPLGEVDPYVPGPYKRWRGNLLRMGIDLVVIVRTDWEDPERRWIVKRPEEFRLAYDDGKVEIWKVIPDVPRPPRGYNPPDAERRPQDRR
ncbi:MAG: hypothetical protein ACJ75H_16300 [Thermoanaerobaculia bacterium]